MDNEMILLSESSNCLDVMEVLASVMTGSGGDLAIAYIRSWSSANAVSLSVVS
jgi:hypothetical protein